MNPYFAKFLSSQHHDKKLEIEIMAEADEFWSCVGKKKNQRWTWYAVERKSGMILAWHNGRRTDESCFCLMEKLSVFPEARYYTDDWKSCQQIHSALKTCHRESGHMENRKAESQFQNPYQTPEPKNNLFFKGRENS